MGVEKEMPHVLVSLVQAIDFLPEATFVVDAAGTIVGWNSRMEDLTNVGRNEILGRGNWSYSQPLFGESSPDLLDLLTGDFPTVRKKYINIAVHNGEVSGETYASHVRGGRGAWLWAKAALIYEPETGKPFGAVQSFRDISRNKSLETKLRMAEAISKDTADFFDNVVQGANVWISFVDSQRAVLLWNDCAEKLSGYSAGEIIGQDASGLIYPDFEYRNKVEADIAAAIKAQGFVRNYYSNINSKDGKQRTISWNITPLADGIENNLGYLSVGTDMTEILEAHEKVNCALEIARDNAFRFQTIFETAADLIMIVDSFGTILNCNSRIKSLLGCSQEGLQGQNIHRIVYPDDRSRVHRLVANTFRQGCRYNEEYRFINGAGELVDVEINSALLKGKDGDSVLMLIRDITERKRAQEQLEFLSFHDPMTGLYNRRYFEEELRRLDVRRQGPISIISCDVDTLKLVNDTLGHQKGDELIKSAARVIRMPFRSCDVVARIGGDEFAVILPRTNSEVAQKARNRILRAVENFNANNPEIPLSISVGVATSSAETSTGDTAMERLYHQSDDAMYQHKANRGPLFQEAVIKILMLALGEKDFLSRGHIERVKDLAFRFGKALALSPAEIEKLRILAQLHDIGNIALSQELLAKPGLFTEGERQEVQKHSEFGYRLALSIPELRPVADELVQHHEWWNGMGYPHGLKEENILVYARMFAIVDAYDAMTSYRPYREKVSPQEALQELKNKSGIQFDPGLVVEFENMLAAPAGF